MHGGRFRLSDMSGKETKHPHRGFDNLCMSCRARPVRVTPQGRADPWSGLGSRRGKSSRFGPDVAPGTQRRSEPTRSKRAAETQSFAVPFWVNLARKDKDVEPSAQVVEPEQIPTGREGDAIVRVLVGEGSPVQLGTPALILDVELPEGGTITMPVPPEFQGFAYLLEGEGARDA